MTSWTWQYDGQEPSGERLRESLCTLGNGYLATRGALSECAPRTACTTRAPARPAATAG